MIRVFIADDHTLFRKGITQLLADTDDMEVVGEASSGTEVLEALPDISCDVLLLDISMPGKSGLGVLERVKAERPGMRVLLVSMLPEEEYAIRVLRVGAAGYISKESNPQELLHAIRRIAGGKKYIGPVSAEQLLFASPEQGAALPHQSLSDREFEVMYLLVSGKTHAGIADSMDINVKTVSTYKTRILNKMNMENLAQLVQYAIRHDVI